jgi:hypothetical protein
MSQQWIEKIKYDSIEPLLYSNNPAVIYFTRKDLLDEKVEPVEKIWELPEVLKILKKQKEDGSFNPVSKHPLLETWRNLRFLIEQYGLNKQHEAIVKAAEFVFSRQSQEGDIRGILGNQYAPYYTGAILYLLIKAGYEKDKRIEKAMKWLIDMRQNDGGWVIGSPGLINHSWKDMCAITERMDIEPVRDFDKTKPFSAAGTGMVIRAFSVHPKYRHSEYAIKAAELLKSKFFKKDNWTWYQHPDNWVRFQFPYWWNNLVAALDSISLIGLPKEDEDINTALNWFVDNQQKNGIWKASYSKIHKSSGNKKEYEMQLWITLNICRIFKKYFGN